MSIKKSRTHQKASSILAIDMGNTSTTLGLFLKGKLLKKKSFKTRSWKSSDLAPFMRYKKIGRYISSYRTLESTNRTLLEWGGQPLEEGHVVFAEEQTKGRGRRGRHWDSPKGKGLYFSILLKT